MRRVLAFLAAAATALAIGVPASAHNPGGAETKLYQPKAEPFGRSYAEWEGAYQIWLNEIPYRKNPQVNPGSRFNCAGQPGGHVVFLGPTGADCSVSDDTALALTPAIGFWECSTGEGLGETFTDLRSCATHNFARDLDPDVYHQQVSIDGKRLRNQRRWVFLTPGEVIDFPKNNLWGAEPGPSKSVTKGFLFILRPLDEGSHRIVIHVIHDTIGEFRWVWRLHVLDD